MLAGRPGGSQCRESLLLLLIYFAEFQASLLALLCPLVWPRLKDDIFSCLCLAFLGFSKMGFSVFQCIFFLSLTLWETTSLSEKLSSTYSFHLFHGNVIFILHGPTQDTCPS